MNRNSINYSKALINLEDDEHIIVEYKHNYETDVMVQDKCLDGPIFYGDIKSPALQAFLPIANTLCKKLGIKKIYHYNKIDDFYFSANSPSHGVMLFDIRNQAMYQSFVKPYEDVSFVFFNSFIGRQDDLIRTDGTLILLVHNEYVVCSDYSNVMLEELLKSSLEK